MAFSAESPLTVVSTPVSMLFSNPTKHGFTKILYAVA